MVNNMTCQDRSFPYLVWKVQSLLKKSGILHQPELVWIILCIVDIAACLAQAIENVIQNCMRGRIIARRCDTAEILEEQFIASDPLNGLRCYQFGACDDCVVRFTLMSKSLMPSAFLRFASRLLTGFTEAESASIARS